jgi:hypothetical protein
LAASALIGAWAGWHGSVFGRLALGLFSAIRGSAGCHGGRDAEKTFLESFSLITESYA